MEFWNSEFLVWSRFQKIDDLAFHNVEQIIFSPYFAPAESENTCCQNLNLT